MFAKIEKQLNTHNNYNERLIVAAMPGKPLSVLKNQLYDCLKEFLLNNCWGDTSSRKLIRNTEFVWQLIDRGLFPQAKKEIQKIIKAASSAESFIPWADMLEVQGHFAEQLYPEKEAPEKMIESFEQAVYVKKMNVDTATLNILNVKAVSLDFKSKGSPLNANEINELQDILNTLLCGELKDTASFKGKVIRLNTLRSIYSTLGEKDKAIEAAYEVMNFMYNTQHNIPFSPINYCSAVLNFLHESENPFDPRYEEALALFGKTNIPSSLQPVYEWKIFVHRLNYFIFRNRLADAEKIVKDTELLKVRHEKTFKETQSIYAQNLLAIGIWYIIEENYNDAASCFSEITDMGNPDICSEYYLQALTWSVICCVITEHKNILHKIGSLKYFIERHFSHYTLHKSLAVSLEKAVKAQKDIPLIFSAVYREMEIAHRASFKESMALPSISCFHFIYAAGNNMPLKKWVELNLLVKMTNSMCRMYLHKPPAPDTGSTHMDLTP
ncbi:MAG: hypothetical protein M9931_09885 [Chitinophagales bacterium]|nr:hypothetical protein [Chitinophagales bacterium]